MNDEASWELRGSNGGGYCTNRKSGAIHQRLSTIGPCGLASLPSRNVYVPTLVHCVFI